jgi:BirA family transcriptional regulator, biotin operon repressor / biotin---[acetyl-CoA-carboxylase] ligase
MRLDPIAVEAGVRLEALGATGSTNAEARQRARHGDQGPLWITATAQTAGRGRHGRSWLSPPGNLYASLLLAEPSPIEHAPQLAFVAALALRDAIVSRAPALAPQLAFKWPNDLLLGGRKCAGILIEGESAIEASAPKLNVIVGVGVNCISHPVSGSGERELAFPATALRAHGAAITAEQLFERLSGTMCVRIAQWERGRGFPAILNDWIACAHGIGEQITVRNDGAELQGRFVGVDPSGRLVLETRNGAMTRIAAGDVFPSAVHGSPQNAEAPDQT